MVASSPLLFFTFQCVLLVMFVIKARGILKNFVMPHLKGIQQESNEKWFSLQEKHAILIAKKKHMATQFLQQEKQISLLTAKLEAWYAAWKNTQIQRQKTFDVQAHKSALRRVEQDRLVQERRAAGRLSKEMLAQTQLEVEKNLKKINTAYTSQALEKLANTNPARSDQSKDAS